MPENCRVREVVATDLPAMKSVIDSTSLFPSDMLSDMVAPYLDGNSSAEIWLVADIAGLTSGLAYCAPESMTEGTQNLLLIAIHKDRQRQGLGRALLRRTEEILMQQSNRILLIETSSLAEFEYTRQFYRKNGYSEEARIRDFYKAGEDKVVFWKCLCPA